LVSLPAVPFTASFALCNVHNSQAERCPPVAYDHTARDTVEALGEFVCQDHGIRKLAHHADLEFFVLALQTEVKREILDRKIGR